MTIELNGKTYLVDSFPEQEKVALAHIEQIEAKMELTKIDLRNLEYGRQFLVDYLVKNVDKFEEAPKQETPANNTGNGGDAA
jgi:hypothetical protein